MSQAGTDGPARALDEQAAGGVRYFDAAGAPGRSFGLRP